MKASGTPKTKNKTQAVRRARALRGNLRFGPLGSFQAGRGRLREPAIRTPSTRMGIDKGDGESIRNDKRPPGTERTRGADFQTRRENSVSSGRGGEKTKPFAVISSHGTTGSRGFPLGPYGREACIPCAAAGSGHRPSRSSWSSRLSRSCRPSGEARLLQGPTLPSGYT